MSNSLQKIGTIEFTKTNVKKEIGDLTSSYSYNDLIKIELEDYFKDVSLSWNKPDTLTKSLKIVHKDFTEESFIISNKSIDFKQKISIVDSLKTLKKLTGLDIHINYN
jgi:hypothetical protein